MMPPRAHPINYLANLARSRAIDRLRSRSFRQKLPELTQGTFDQPSRRRQSASDQLAATEQCTRKFARRLQTMDAIQRQAVELSFFSGLSHKRDRHPDE